MTIRIDDIVPLSIARARFSELADDARDGGEKIITKNGAAYVALIDARRLDHYHRLERERAECACAALLHGGGDDGGNGGDAAGDAARGGGRDSPDGRGAAIAAGRETGAANATDATCAPGTMGAMAAPCDSDGADALAPDAPSAERRAGPD
ncbi:type II toxin-antitoxin system Phd/YefM family antitoxin [Burkholderia pseudomallei]|uniref:type II toxin-antitoxin system Phd/YefM family antitoxin n=1 Tax=Burkholderia pseudomallei TaxID=28450 RepID=UPI000A1A1BCF|nr:type II toxin-antitoxin system Phd/YefM family antitoxin [Burkholderia pseudomallei]ARK72967.1 prevent-host-death protein [Burkholderia pseudomallei]ARL13275.1 prevent-host-death protein [Burkholderia pseudomallei]ARM04772.1 prevent-host-death protein [Burkholderia pseudomallei]NRE51523.1 type II toxin-antitoxin system Phd/YefM family antitoxin [Burkholderia pseudomallei]RIV61701.1 type II toxin-antitoxin system Phd/YefM family antitoxin [Burkholderia pseudomallei]